MEARGFVDVAARTDAAALFSSVYIAALLAKITPVAVGQESRAAKLGGKLAEKAESKGVLEAARAMLEEPGAGGVFVREDIYYATRGPHAADVGLKLRRDDIDEPLELELKFNVAASPSAPGGPSSASAPVFRKVGIPVDRLNVDGVVPFERCIDWAGSVLAAQDVAFLASALPKSSPPASPNSYEAQAGVIDTGAGIRLSGVTAPLVFVAKARAKKKDEALVKKGPAFVVEHTLVRTRVVEPSGKESPPRFYVTNCVEGGDRSTLAHVSELWQQWQASDPAVFVGGYPALVQRELQRALSAKCTGSPSML